MQSIHFWHIFKQFRFLWNYFWIIISVFPSDSGRLSVFFKLKCLFKFTNRHIAGDNLSVTTCCCCCYDFFQEPHLKLILHKNKTAILDAWNNVRSEWFAWILYKRIGSVLLKSFIMKLQFQKNYFSFEWLLQMRNTTELNEHI